MTLVEHLLNRRILLTMGPGGVGKTTVAAALGLQAAVLGRRSLVLTLDPALRLAQALGLQNLAAGEVCELSVAQLAEAGIEARCPLWVEMLDTRRAWEGVIAREVTDRTLERRILEHPYFRRMSQDLAGAREYAATEQLYHIYQRGGFDLVILDTPPTVHGVDFLEAPDRVLSVLEHDATRWLLRPLLLAGRAGLRVLNFSGGYAVRTIARFTGLDFLQELAAFIDLFSSLVEGFRRRAASVLATLRSNETTFVLVTGADPGLHPETEFLFRRLANQQVPPQVIVINRVTGAPLPLPASPSFREELLSRAGPGGAPVLEAMEQAHRMLTALAERDRVEIEHIRTGLCSTCTVLPVPLLDTDVHDLRSLDLLRQALFAPS